MNNESRDESTQAARRATIRDVAKQAGVSPATVSLTLSGRGRIADVTRQRILQVSHELNYRLPLRRRTTADQRVFTIPTGNWRERGPVIDIQQELDMLQLEVDQREREGYDVSSFLPVVAQLYRTEPTLQTIEALYDRVNLLTLRPDYPYVEPTSLEDISIEIALPVARPQHLEREALYDRIYGGWLGRCIGCTLGKPIENIGTSDEVETYLRGHNAYPLVDYVPAFSLADHPNATPNAHSAQKGNFDAMPRDDDLDYTILNLRLLEQYGMNFTTEQVAQMWLQHLAYNNIYTAERIAYANLVKQYSPRETAEHRNPFREFIGAQIRADIFGYTAPGDPANAARRAFMDARLSHVRNGIYGEMMVAAMVASAFAALDVETVVQAGLAAVPPRSRLAEALWTVIEQVQRGDSWQTVASWIGREFSDFDLIHVIPNACVVVLALLRGEGDFGQTILIAAMCGLDADCNTATAGSVMGTLLGAQAIPSMWAAPLNDRVESSVMNEADNIISSLARRTLNLVS